MEEIKKWVLMLLFTLELPTKWLSRGPLEDIPHVLAMDFPFCTELRGFPARLETLGGQTVY